MTNGVLQNFYWTKIRPFVLYLEPTGPYEAGTFFTFDSESELLEVLRSELLEFTSADEDLREELQEDIDSNLPDSIKMVDESVIENLNNCIAGWTVGYIGTLEGCLNGQSKSEQWFRSQFRVLFELEGGQNNITEAEVENFKAYMVPEWER